MGYFNPIPERNIFTDIILKWITDIIVVILIAVLFIIYYCDKAQVVGNSMAPELSNEETILIDKLSYTLGQPERFDVIAYNSETGIIIKRIIGLPGEKIKIVDSKIYINGKELKDIYFEGKYESGNLSTEIEIGTDEYFVMGDSRNVSEDSRFSYVGNINIKDILGIAWFVAAPFDKMGFIE